MKVSYNWLKSLIDFPHSPPELARALTDTGLEVEHLEEWCSIAGGLEGVVIGKVLTCERHPNADRLHLTTVDTGDAEPRRIVCGAPNVAAGQTVVVALPGATLHPLKGDPFAIKSSKIRGEVSEGMICAEDEIGMGESHAGIIVLQDGPSPGTPASAYFKVQRDWVLEIGLTPNRADAASHLGVARDIRALIGEARLDQADVSTFAEGRNSNTISVSVTWPEAVIRYSSLELTDVRVGPSPDWIQNRLKSIGLRPINNVVDVTNLVMFECGQPLHAFDADKIRQGKVIVGKAAPGSVFTALDQRKLELDGSELMIQDAEGSMCMAGVFGGFDSGVSDTTCRIFLESACFHPVHVRKSARRHGLHTDSSFRFERGTDPRMTIYALHRAALLLIETAGAKVHGPVSDHYPVPVIDRQLTLRTDYLESLCGVSIPVDRVTAILNDLGMEAVSQDSTSISVGVPPFKVDVTRPADLAEEVLRIFGYNNIPMPSRLLITPGRSRQPDPEAVLDTVSTVLSANGFREILTNSLTRPVSMEPNADSSEVRVLNPLSGDLSVLRSGLLTTGLEVIAYNINRRQKELALFETGKTYRAENGKYSESHVLGIWCTGQVQGEHWKGKHPAMDIFRLKAVLENVFSHVIPAHSSHLLQAEDNIPGLDQAVSYNAGKHRLAFAGKVGKALLRSMDIGQDVWYAEVGLEYLTRLSAQKAFSASGPPRFPEVRRDLSMLLDDSVRYDTIESLAFQTESRLLRQVNLFDVYEGDKIAAGKKSYAISFTLRDDESTLQDKQIDAVMDRLMKQFESKLGAVIRKS
ncbi:MAG: phenylalanyl-tRNA ligase subunit beta [Bacteroidota bacterium]|jgi:phenylalanyl-tRNA synthetase beta chain